MIHAPVTGSWTEQGIFARPVAYFTKEVNPGLAKPHLNFKSGLAKPGLIYLAKQTTGIQKSNALHWTRSAPKLYTMFYFPLLIYFLWYQLCSFEQTFICSCCFIGTGAIIEALQIILKNIGKIR